MTESIGQYGEPWTMKPSVMVPHEYCVFLHNGFPLQLVYREHEMLALRAVECVNACAGHDPTSIQDLVEALCECVRELSNYEKDVFGSKRSTVMGVIEFARAALAKWEGE